MAGSLEQRLAEADAEIKDILRCYETEEAPVVELRDRARIVLVRYGLMLLERHRCEYVGVYPGNRFGDMIIPAHVTKLAKGFFGGGFSFEELSTLYCLEMPLRSSGEHAKIAKANREMIESSAGVLPAYPDEARDCKVLSLSGSHTNQVFRCFFHGAPSEDEKMSENGRYSMHKLQLDRPAFGKAVAEGVEMWVMNRAVAERHPRLPDLFMEVGNLTQALAESETRFEVLLKMHGIAQRLFKAAQGSAADPDELWSRVLRDGARGHPHFSEELGDFVLFLKNLSGGLNEPVFLEYLSGFNRALTDPRIVKGPMWGALAKVVIGEAHACAEFRIAVAMAMLSASAQYTGAGNEQTLFQVGDVQALGSDRLRDHVRNADGMIKKGIKLASEHCDTPAGKWVCYLFSIRLVHHVCRKADQSRGAYKSLDEICRVFLSELATVADKVIASPWKLSPAEKTETPAVTAVSAGVVKFQSGNLANSVELLEVQHNIKVGATVQHKDSTEKFTVMNITEKYVLIADHLGTGKTVQHHDFRKQLYKAIAKDEADVVLKYDDVCVTANFDWKSELVAARLKIAIDAHHQAHVHVCAGLAIITEPAKNKGVRTLRQFGAGGLVLTPVTPNVTNKLVTEKVTASMIATKTTLENPKTKKQYQVSVLSSARTLSFVFVGGGGISGKALIVEPSAGRV